MIPQEVSLSEAARAACARMGISEVEVQRARAKDESNFEAPMYLVVTTSLEDGRLLRLSCRHDMPEHVVSVHLADDASPSQPSW